MKPIEITDQKFNSPIHEKKLGNLFVVIYDIVCALELVVHFTQEKS